MTELIIGIVGILVSIAGIYFGRKDTKIVIVNRSEMAAAQPAQQPAPRGWARWITGLGMLCFLAGFAVFAFEVISAMMSVAGNFGRLQPGAGRPAMDFGSFELLPLGFGLCFIGIVITLIGKFFSRG